MLRLFGVFGWLGKGFVGVRGGFGKGGTVVEVAGQEEVGCRSVYA